MTQELKSLTPKELNRLRKAIETIEKAYGLTDEDIDSFFVLVKHAKEYTETVDGLAKSVDSLSKAMDKDRKEDFREQTGRLMGYFSKKAEGIKDV